MSANAYWAFTDFMMSQTSSFETALLWSKVLTFWPLVPVLMLNFALAFTESDLLKNKLIYLVMYVPALTFSFVDLTTNLISVAPVLHPWGYAAAYPASSVGTRSDGLWAGVLAILTIFLLINYYNQVIDKTRKQQTKFVAIALAIPTFISLITDSLFVVEGINFPVLGSIAGTFTALLVVYAMIRYELFGFRPEIAAENIFSSMADSIILADLQGKIVKVNHSLVEVSGYSEDELIGKSIFEVVLKADLSFNNKPIKEFVAELQVKRELKNYEMAFHSKSGADRTVLVSSSMVSDSRNNDVGLAIVLHDVTERKAMEQKLLKAERFASIGELAGILGHDLRNPLNAIRAGSYYLKNKYTGLLDDKDMLIFESIDRSIDYSDKIVIDLIDYASEIKLQPENATAKSLVTGALALVLPPPNVQIIDETHEEPSLNVDVERICRAFKNIIVNAFDAMPNGGKLTVKSQEATGILIFSFTDTGDGMGQETLSKIWTPLFTTKAKGMGFGLSICKRIVEAHAGKIIARSEPKVGTTIIVELPLTVSV
jgi:PAS domain S-box-containing protein